MTSMDADLGALIDALDEITMVVSADGRIVAANEQAHARFGLAADPMTGRTLAEVLPSAEAAHLVEILRAGSGRAAPDMIEIPDPGAPARGSRLHFIPRHIGLSDGTQALLLREAAEAKPLPWQERALEERFRLATEAAEIGVWDMDLRSGRLEWDSAMLNLYGISAREFSGVYEDWRNRLHPDDVTTAEGRFQKALKTGQPFDDEYRILTPQGKLRFVRARAQVFHDRDGAPVRAVGVNYDISEQKNATVIAAAAARDARRAHDRLTRLANNAPAALFEYREDADGGISFPFYNENLAAMLGVSTSAIAADGGEAFANVHPEDLAYIVEEITYSRKHLTPFAVRYRLNHPTQGLRWIMASTLPVREGDGATLWYGTLFDMTDQHEMEQRASEAAAAVKQAHDRMSLIANIAPVGLYEYRVLPDGSFDWPYFSERFADLVGLDAATLSADPTSFHASVHPDDLATTFNDRDSDRRDLRPWEARFRILHPTRGTIWLSGRSTPREDADGAVVYTGALLDVSADVAREDALHRAHLETEMMRAENEKQALHDGLTGLPNRRFFDRVLADRMECHSKKGCVITLIRMDLDHFKYVNDTLGHEAGDRVLTRISEILGDTIGAKDFAARIGGDEFSILLAEGASDTDAHEIVARIQSELVHPLIHEGRQCRFGASFGIAQSDCRCNAGHDIQMFADAALYRAKSTGRNRLEWFTPHMHEQIMTDRRLAIEIQEALDADQFLPYFQPQVCARTGAFVGLEALLRWRHPERGILAPGEFMNVAEQLRLVPDLDRRIMERTRKALSRWAEAGITVPKISFNVSSGRLHDPGLVTMAIDMARSDTRVTFELLESVLVEEESEVFRFHLDQIREAGVEIEIDDFGSGHASIIGLMQIGPAALKIDQRIVAPVADDPRARDLVRAIVEMADTLGIDTIAEGIETPKQAEVLGEIGCKFLQGFLFGRPMDEAAFTAHARARDAATA